MTMRTKMATNRKRNRNSKKTDSAVALAKLADTLSLTTLRDHISMLLKKAEADALSYSDFALQMLQLESIARNNRRLTRNLKRSGLPAIIEGLDTYDFSVRPKLEAPLVRELENCRFAEENGRNIICVGRPGLGKSRVLDAIARAACDKGYSVKKVMTADLLEDLHASIVDGSYVRTFRRYEKYDILYLDEFGYDPFDANATKHLFRLVSARHRNRSILLAANTGFKNWKKFFPSEAQAVATVDRLIDQATILRFTGKSFRKPKHILGADID
jgi:DNA replication protein DnaC